jgi:hypothetical protein
VHIGIAAGRFGMVAVTSAEVTLGEVTTRREP